MIDVNVTVCVDRVFLDVAMVLRSRCQVLGRQIDDSVDENQRSKSSMDKTVSLQRNSRELKIDSHIRHHYFVAELELLLNDIVNPRNDALDFWYDYVYAQG